MKQTGLLKLRPFLKPTLWSGKGLSQRYGGEMIGEAYLLSALPGRASFLKDELPFDTYLNAAGKSATDFPLLIKAIDAAMPLSVQVHPDIRQQGGGKDEVWLIDKVTGKVAEAFVYIGFRRFVDEEELLFHCRRGTLLTLLNPVPVVKDDVLFIPGGTVHALGGGVSLFELQQSCDVTYRIYDYGRGRPLQREQAFSVLKYDPSLPVRTKLRPGKLFGALPAFPFGVEIITLDGTLKQEEIGAAALVVLKGKGEWVSPGNSGKFSAGDCFFAPQNSCYTMNGRGMILRVDCSAKEAPDIDKFF